MSTLPDHRFFLGTDDGLRILDGANAVITAAALHDAPVRDIAVDRADPNRAWAGCALGGYGLHHTTDGGDTIDCVGFEDRWVWGVDRLPDGNLYVGTEPPGLFRHEDDGTVSALDGVHEVAGRDAWHFGYEPFEAGHIHGVTAHRDRPTRLFAAVEVGGVLVSDDSGSSWHSRLRGMDLHRIAIAPDDPDRVYAATESGLQESSDGGETWSRVAVTTGQYAKHLAFDADGILYAPVADDMGDTDIRLVVRDDEWLCRGPVTNASVLAFATADGRVLLQQTGDDRRLLVSDDGGRSWNPAGPSLPMARCIVPVPN